MRQAILEGINLSRPPPPPPPLPPPAFLPPAMVPPFYPMHPLYPPRPLGSMPPPHHQHRPRAFPGLTTVVHSAVLLQDFVYSELILCKDKWRASCPKILLHPCNLMSVHNICNVYVNTKAIILCP